MTKPSAWHFYTWSNAIWREATGIHFTHEEVAHDVIDRIFGGWELRFEPGQIFMRQPSMGLNFLWCRGKPPL